MRPPPWPLLRSAIVLAAAGAVVGCEGTVDEGLGPAGPNGVAQGGSGGPRDPSQAGYDEDDPGARDTPAPATRLARLSHHQWASSVRDLLGLEDVSVQQQKLRADPRQSGFLFDNLAEGLSVDEALLRGYERVAAELAERVASDSELLQALSPPDDRPLDERGEQLVDELGLRAHRRPLTQSQRDAYLALFEAGPTLYASMGDFEAGARALIEGLLQSPHFLYRFEQSEETAGGVIPLDDYEIASRLSYVLWDTMPDQDLFDAAAAGELVQADEVAKHAKRMLRDPRGEAMLVRFHAQLLEAERFDTISPAASVFDGSGQLGEHARTEQARFIAHTLLDQEGSYADLLTSPETFVNAELADIYGLPGDYDETFARASLNPDERAGLFTQVGFLALNATAMHPDPIHRGAFLARRIACLQIAAPPDNIPALPDPEGRTNRQRVEDHTEQPGSTCANCHTTLINPFGFPFEGYDAVGRFRTEDLGMPVDSAASPRLDKTATPVEDAVELAHALAASQSVHECYAQRWVEFVYGRARQSEDDPLIRRLANASLENDSAVVDLVVSLVRSEAFLTRSQEELP